MLLDLEAERHTNGREGAADYISTRFALNQSKRPASFNGSAWEKDAYCQSRNCHKTWLGGYLAKLVSRPAIGLSSHLVSYFC